ncbi:MAG: hypothetical protein II925_01400, partial [Methanomicrobium sp.]|nr:hypothetical protein [Methanomicrobium sp.]
MAEEMRPQRPGRKALFTGAQTKQPSTTVVQDSSFAFVLHCTGVVEEFISGNRSVRVNEDQSDEKSKACAVRLNQLLSSLESQSETGADGRAGKDDETAESVEDLRNYESEVNRLNESIENLKSELSAANVAVSEKESLVGEITREKEKLLEDIRELMAAKEAAEAASAEYAAKAEEAEKAANAAKAEGAAAVAGNS